MLIEGLSPLSSYRKYNVFLVLHVVKNGWHSSVVQVKANFLVLGWFRLTVYCPLGKHAKNPLSCVYPVLQSSCWPLTVLQTEWSQPTALYNIVVRFFAFIMCLICWQRCILLFISYPVCFNSLALLILVIKYVRSDTCGWLVKEGCVNKCMS